MTKHEIGFKSVCMIGRKREKIKVTDPVVNRPNFRDMFGVVSRFVRVGGDFV